MKKVTIDDVARRAGVSKGTVSAVINERNTVQLETRETVLSAMKELNYRPRGSARNLKNPASRYSSIGLLIRELDNPFYTAIALGVLEYAKSKGYLVMIASSEGDHTFEEKITQSFSGKDIRGAIIAPVLEGTAEIEHLFRLKMINFPFVLLENVSGIQANVVSIDNIKAVKEAILDQGKTTIEDIRKVFDLTWGREIGVHLCPWSFKMLQSAGQGALDPVVSNRIPSSAATVAPVNKLILRSRGGSRTTFRC